MSFRYPDAAGSVVEHVSPGQKGADRGLHRRHGLRQIQPHQLDTGFDATEGQVLVDGMDVREYTLASLTKSWGYVP